MKYDVVIIGAGVVGCAVARELSRYNANILVLEQHDDVCAETSKANSGIVHSGIDAKKGTLMAKMNVIGNSLMEPLSKELDFSFKRNGSLVVCLNEEDKPNLQKLFENGVANGVEGLQILDRDALLQLEPNITPDAVSAVYAPSGGIVCPFGLTIALAENANVNGVEFKFNTRVQKLTKANEKWFVETDNTTFETKTVVNAAGVYADVFNNMVSEQKINITPRRGDYCLLDKTAGGHVSTTVFQLPTKFGKGVLVTPTVHGNLLVGPTAIDIEDKEATNTTAEGLNELIAKASNTVKNIPMRQVITSFSGLRAHEDKHEFILGEAKGAEGFFNCAGIESPGLTSAPAIGIVIANLIGAKLGLNKKVNFVETRKGILDPKTLPREKYAELIKKEPSYGSIVCRCEQITEGEIIDAIRRPLGARNLDAIKRRTRAQMGRCHGGFCSPRLMQILARELNISMAEVTKSGGESNYIVGTVKDNW